MPDFNDRQFRIDLYNIFNSNPFIKAYVNQKQSEGEIFAEGSCITEAQNYVNSFPDVEGGRELNSLLNGLQQLHGDLVNHGFDYEHEMPLNVITNMQFRLATLRAVMPSFQEQIDSFISKAMEKGASLGDDGIRTLKSLSHIMDDLSSRCEMQDALENLRSWKKDKDQLDTSYEQIQKSVQSFSKDCVNNNVDGTTLDSYDKKLKDNITKLENELEQLKSETVREQHTKEFNECHKRFIANKDLFQKACDKEIDIDSQIADVKHFQENLVAMRKQIAANEELLKGYAAEEDSLNQQIKIADDTIAEQQKELAQYEPAKDFLEHLSQDEKQKIDDVSILGRENQTIESDVQSFMRKLNLRRYGSNMHDAWKTFVSTGQQPSYSDMEYYGIREYKYVKDSLIRMDSSFKDLFDELENNPKYDIAKDFNTLIGDKVRSRFTENESRINEIKDSALYKNYQDASQKVQQWQTKKYAIEGQESHKDELKSQLEDLKARQEDAKSVTEGWMPRAKELIGEHYVEYKHPSVSKYCAMLESQLKDLKHKQEILLTEGFRLSSKIAKDSKVLAQLKEDLNPVKIVATEQEISKFTSKLSTIDKLKEEKKKLDEKATSLSKNVVDVRSKMDKALNKQYSKIGERLENIVKHFDDVQSFWSRGKSDVCEKMYKSMENLSAKLKNPGSMEDMVKAFKETRQLAQNYLDAKNAQNRSKTFASDQRYWRLSMAEEAIGLLDNATQVFTHMQEIPGINNVKEFIKASNGIKVEDSVKRLNANIDKTSKEIQQNQPKKGINKQNSKEQVFEDINKPYVM